MTDINSLSDISNWTGSGTATVRSNFSITSAVTQKTLNNNAVFDGNGYTITLNYTGGAHPGLFIANTGATVTIKNLIINVINYTATNLAGIVVGNNTSTNGFTLNLIDVGVTGSFNIPDFAGGIVGDTRNGYNNMTLNMTGCYCTGNSAGLYSAPIARICYNANFKNCFTTGNLTNTYSSGFAWSIYGTGTIYDCYVYGNCTTSYTGSALLTQVLGNTTIKNCYHYGTLSTNNSSICRFIESGSTLNVTNCFSRNATGTGIGSNNFIWTSSGTYNNTNNGYGSGTWDANGSSDPIDLGYLIDNNSTSGDTDVWNVSNDPFRLQYFLRGNWQSSTTQYTVVDSNSSTNPAFNAGLGGGSGDAPIQQLEINYGDERNTLYSSLFTGISTDANIDFNAYKYSIDGTNYTNYLSELSILDPGTYENFRLKYPHASTGVETISNQYILVVNSTSKNILPKPRIAINYGDERSTLFSKIFKTLNSNYDALNFNSYTYSTDGTTYTKYLSELSILDASTYSTFYIKYPDSTNSDTETTSQKLYLVVSSTSKNILPKPRIEFDYGDERNTLFSKIFKTLNSSNNELNFNEYMYSINGTNYNNYLSELSILDYGAYDSFYIKYKDVTIDESERTSQKLYLIVNQTDKLILPRPRIEIDYGDVRSDLFGKIFKTLNTDNNNLNFNSYTYTYTANSQEYSGHLSELSILDADGVNPKIYDEFYINYPDSIDGNIESQQLYVVVNPISKNILPKPRIEIDYGDERSDLFTKIFKTLNTDNDDLNFNSYTYIYTVNSQEYEGYLSELSILDADGEDSKIYDDFYINYPDSIDGNTTSQQLYLVVNPTNKNILPRPRIEIDYGDDRDILFTKIFKVLNSNYDNLNFNSYRYSTNEITYAKYLSEITILDIGTYSTFYIKYPNSVNNDVETTSQLLHIVVNSTNNDILPRPRITIVKNEIVTFTKLYKVIHDYDYSSFVLSDFRFAFDSDYINSQYISSSGVGQNTIHLEYYDTINDEISERMVFLDIAVFPVTIELLNNVIHYGDSFDITNFISTSYLSDPITVRGLYIQMYNGNQFVTLSRNQIIDQVGTTTFRVCINDNDITISGNNDFTQISQYVLEFEKVISKQTLDLNFNKSFIMNKADMDNDNILKKFLNKIMDGESSDQYEFVVNDVLSLHNTKTDIYVECTKSFISQKSSFTSHLIPYIDTEQQSEISFIDNKLYLSQILELTSLYSNKIRIILAYDEQITITTMRDGIGNTIEIRPLNYDYVEYSIADFDNYDSVLFERHALGQGEYLLEIETLTNSFVSNITLNAHVAIINNPELFELEVTNDDNVVHFGEKLLLKPKFGTTIINTEVEYDLNSTILYAEIAYLIVYLPNTSITKIVSFTYAKEPLMTILVSDDFLITNASYTFSCTEFTDNVIKLKDCTYKNLTISIGANIKVLKQRLHENKLYGKILSEYILHDNELIMYIKNNNEYTDISTLFTYQNNETIFKISINGEEVGVTSNVGQSLLINKNYDTSTKTYSNYYAITTDNTIFSLKQINTDSTSDINKVVLTILLNEIDDSISNDRFKSVYLKYFVDILKRDDRLKVVLERFGKLYFEETNVISEIVDVRQVRTLHSTKHYADIEITLHPQMQIYKNENILRITGIGFNPA